MMSNTEFEEGVRALLVDKDKTPKWRPPTLAEVSDATVGVFFSGIGDNELDVTLEK